MIRRDDKSLEFAMRILAFQCRSLLRVSPYRGQQSQEKKPETEKLMTTLVEIRVKLF